MVPELAVISPKPEMFPVTLSALAPCESVAPELMVKLFARVVVPANDFMDAPLISMFL